MKSFSSTPVPQACSGFLNILQNVSMSVHEKIDYIIKALCKYFHCLFPPKFIKEMIRASTCICTVWM